MDDDYELVSKRLVTQLKEENAKLKTQLSSIPEPSSEPIDNSALIEQIVATLHEESQKERELILENLGELKELNKSTLDNVLNKTQQLDERLEGIVDTTEGLVEHLSNLVESLSNFKGSFNTDSINEKISELLKNQSVPVSMPSLPENLNTTEIMSKLDEISIFMENLRVLLSYVKPADLSMDKPSDSFIPPQNFSNNQNQQ